MKLISDFLIQFLMQELRVNALGKQKMCIKGQDIELVPAFLKRSAFPKNIRIYAA
jgi:hypothetical protein